jgi:hypothetical protein
MWRRFLKVRNPKSRSSFLLYGFFIGEDLLYSCYSSSLLLIEKNTLTLSRTFIHS